MKTNSCLICDMVADEVSAGERVIFENDDFLAFIPFFSEYPYGIVSKAHKQNLLQFGEREKTNRQRLSGKPSHPDSFSDFLPT